MANIKIMALGGLGENGKNMYLVENDDFIFIFDAGLKFPDIDMFGIDAVVPDISYLLEKKEKIAGIFVSHGHEDNIGAIPYILRNVIVNVYGTHFTISLIESLLTSEKMDIKKYRLYRINESKVLTFKDNTITFFNTSHSIPESVGIALKTKDGTIIYATDFNFMPMVDPRYSTSYGKLTDLAKENVIALLTESIGTGAIERTNNDLLLEHNFKSILTSSAERIVVAAYSSDLSRIQKIVDMATEAGRSVAFVGKKGEKIVEIAMENNYLRVPSSKLVDLENAKEHENLVIIVHGPREEIYSMLLKMTLDEEQNIKFSPQDKVVIMCPTVSGMEKIVTNVINCMYRADIDLTVFDKNILRSSHASRNDLKLMYNLVKPKYIIPIKGEYRHMYEQLLVTKEAGYNRENVILLENGEVINFKDGKATDRCKIKVGDVFVDGSLIGDVNEVVIEHREVLSNEGAVIINIYYDLRARKIVKTPTIISKGVVGKMENVDLSSRIITLTTSIFENALWKKNYSLQQAEQTIVDEISRLIYRVTKHKPLVVPVCIDINNIKHVKEEKNEQNKKKVNVKKINKNNSKG